MAELNTVARPYTKAAFEHLRCDKGNLDQWSEMLTTTAVVAQHETMKLVLGNPGLTSEAES